eukprot:COSAG01_NODE_3911_length_5548_cov_3.636998_5_plen_242_part_00
MLRVGELQEGLYRVKLCARTGHWDAYLEGTPEGSAAAAETRRRFGLRPAVIAVLAAWRMARLAAVRVDAGASIPPAGGATRTPPRRRHSGRHRRRSGGGSAGRSSPTSSPQSSLSSPTDVLLPKASRRPSSTRRSAPRSGALAHSPDQSSSGGRSSPAGPVAAPSSPSSAPPLLSDEDARSALVSAVRAGTTPAVAAQQLCGAIDARHAAAVMDPEALGRSLNGLVASPSSGSGWGCAPLD